MFCNIFFPISFTSICCFVLSFEMFFHSKGSKRASQKERHVIKEIFDGQFWVPNGFLGPQSLSINSATGIGPCLSGLSEGEVSLCISSWEI